MSAVVQEDEATLIPNVSTLPEGKDVSNAPPPLPSLPESADQNESLAYVGDIDETPDVSHSIEKPNDDILVGLDANEHFLLDLNDHLISNGDAVSEEPEDTAGPNVPTEMSEILPDSGLSVQQFVPGVQHVEEHTETEKNVLPGALSESDVMKATRTLDKSFAVDKCESPTEDDVQDINTEFIPDESSPNTKPVEKCNIDESIETQIIDVINQSSSCEDVVPTTDIANEDATTPTNEYELIKESIPIPESKDFEANSADDKPENQIASNRFASDPDPIVAAKKEPNDISTTEDREDHKTAKVSTSSKLTTNQKFSAELSSLSSDVHRASNLPRVATLYKTMKPTMEKSRMASRGEIPFIFRRNGSHVYITNYRDAVVTPRISRVTMPKHRGTPSVTSVERMTSSNDRKPKPDIDDCTLDELLDTGMMEKVEPNSSPIDVRQIDSLEGSFDAMRPKNLDTTAFSS